MSSLREELLAGIRSHREQFEAAGDRAEELRTLPNDAVATLRALGLFWLKTPAELGGTPLPPVEFSDVIEELAYIDTSTAWAAMIGAGCNGLAGGWLPEAGARRIFGPAADRASGGPARAAVRAGLAAAAGLAGGRSGDRGPARAARHRDAGRGRVPGPRALGLLQRHRARRLADRRVQGGRRGRPGCRERRRDRRGGRRRGGRRLRPGPGSAG